MVTLSELMATSCPWLPRRRPLPVMVTAALMARVAPPIAQVPVMTTVPPLSTALWMATGSPALWVHVTVTAPTVLGPVPHAGTEDGGLPSAPLESGALKPASGSV